MSDFTSLQMIAHKMRSSALYCGAIRMGYICETLEHHFKYKKQGNPDALYQYFHHVIKLTMAEIEKR
jgi:hypothetical protein